MTPEQLTRAASEMEAALARLDIQPGRTTEAERAAHGVRVVHPVQRVTRHHVQVVAHGADTTDWSSAHGDQQTQSRSTLQERRLFPTLGDNFGEQVDHLIVSSIDTAGNI